MKRALISLLVGAGLMMAPAAYAAAPLAPGGAAGVRQAENFGGVPVYAIVGGVLVIVGFVAVLSGNGGGHAGSTTGCSPNGSCPSSSSTGTGS